MRISYGEDYLAHHGILGQRWGFRRYQNPDGSLTEAGRRRYGYNLDVRDHSKLNVARIRLGEARRVHDTAKQKYDIGQSSMQNVREARKRVKLAKKTVREEKRIRRGENLYSKGHTIEANNTKMAVAGTAAGLAASGIYYLTKQPEGRALLRNGHQEVLRFLDKYGMTTGASIMGLAGAYAGKKYIDNHYMRKFYNARWSGKHNIKNVGSDEYENRMKELNDKSKKKR